jgi:murein DD-endopeptidase MepM/ murein hydrolase activator NlpD
MNHRNGIFVIFLFLALRTFAQETVHVVEKGETIYSIARSFKVAPEDLMKFNNIADASKLQIGRRLQIPGGPAPSAGVSSGNGGSLTANTASRAVINIEYRVAKNETLYGIARDHNITLQALRKANNFSQDHILREGERILIPVSGPTTQVAGTGTASSGSGAAAGSSGNAGAAPAAKPKAAAVPSPEPRPTAAKPVDTSLRWPVTAKGIAYMTGKLSGVVVTGEKTESVKSLTHGTVVSAGPYRGFGRVAIVQVTGAYLYVYGGCESLAVKEGDRVSPGTELGKLGVDAVSQKPQLFFLVYRNNVPVDPSKAPRA